MRFLFALFCALLPLGSTFEAPAVSDPITISGFANWSDEVQVSEGVHWSPSSKLAAKRLIARLGADLDSMLVFYKKRGAEDVLTTYRKPVQQILRVYGLKYEEISYQSLNSAGKKMSREYVFPKMQVSYANNLVRLNASKCSLRGFEIFNIGTWFKTQCQVQKPSVDVFLRAQMATELSFGPGNLPDVVNYELSKLRYVLSNKIPFEIVGQKLTFRGVGSPFGSDNKVWLGSASGWFDFKINVDAKNWKARVDYFSPDPQKLSENTTLDLPSRMIHF